MSLQVMGSFVSYFVLTPVVLVLVRYKACGLCFMDKNQTEKSLALRGNEPRESFLCITSRIFMTKVRPPPPSGIQVPTRLSSIPP